MTQENATLNELRDIDDAELMLRLRRLVRADQTLTARLLLHLGEVDARGLYRERACSSMFVYCVEELQMSESEAYLRIQAARLCRQFPLLVQLVAQGAKGKREIEVLLAEIAPKPDVPCRMRKLPEPCPPLAAKVCDSVPTSTPPVASFTSEVPRPRATNKPLSPGRYKLEFTAGQALHDKVQQLQDLLRHQVPDGDLAVLVERAVDLLIDKTMQQRFAQTRAPKKKRPAKRRSRSRYIPRAVVRAVHQRDAGQCTFVSSDGKRCGARGFLELHHHDVPYARGGEASVENLRLVCRAHNALFAERDFGTAFGRANSVRRDSQLDPLSRASTFASRAAETPALRGCS